MVVPWAGRPSWILPDANRRQRCGAQPPRSNRIAPTLEQGTHDRQHRFECFAVADPAAQTLAVDRLDHLAVAGRGDVALALRVLVEGEHGPGIVQLEKLRDP